MKNRNLFFLLFLFLITLSCNKERRYQGAFQGTWYKEGFDNYAFTVREDSMFFPGLDKGYFYHINKDSLVIQFTNKTTNSQLIYFSNEKIIAWDMMNSGDTITLLRLPNMIDEIDTLNVVKDEI